MKVATLAAASQWIGRGFDVQQLECIWPLQRQLFVGCLGCCGGDCSPGNEKGQRDLRVECSLLLDPLGPAKFSRDFQSVLRVGCHPHMLLEDTCVVDAKMRIDAR